MNRLTHYLTRTVLLLLFVTAGCDSAEENTDPENLVGSYELTVTGTVQRTANGPLAQFGAATDPSTGISGFGLSFGNASSEYVAITRKGGRPGTGSHTIAALDNTAGDLPEDEFIATYYFGTQVFVSTGGALTLTRSENDRLEGTVNFTATSLLPTQPGQVTISGTFTAVGGDLTN